MFNGMLKSDDVEVYEINQYATTFNIGLAENCKSNVICVHYGTSVFGSLELPFFATIGKIINITVMPNGNSAKLASIGVLIRHSDVTLFTLKQGTVSFMYIGQYLSGLTPSNSAISGWVVIGGVQGDTTITGQSHSVAVGNGAYCTGSSGVAIGGSAIGGSTATALGRSANANGQSSIAAGNNASSVGQYSTAIGTSSSASAQYSTVIGYSAYAGHSKCAFKSNAVFSGGGDAQAGKFILMRQTTDATPSVITATNAAPISANILSLLNGSTFAFKGIVVAKDGTTLDSAMWEVTALMRRGANASTTALVGTPTITKVFNDAGASAWTIALTADTTNGGGAITVTGEAGKTIRWVSNIDSAEVM